MGTFRRSWQISSTRWWEGRESAAPERPSPLVPISDEDSSERLDLSPGTLDSILDLTCAQPEFEGVLGSLEPPPTPPPVARRAVEVRVLGPQQPHPPNEEVRQLLYMVQ